MKKFYITTAIDYANGSPHLGHAYEKVLADVIARHRRLVGDQTHFVTGLDEHGQKVQQTAQKRGMEPQAFCDTVAKEFQSLCERLLITHDDYIRTTEPRHKDVVRNILTMLHDKGEIYKAEYTGYYSVRNEQFVREKDKVDGEWPAALGEVVELTENNYFFKLSQYQDWLIDYIRSHPDFIYPAFRARQVLEFLKEPLNDLCISRPKERLAWGVPLPFDEDYVTYVWFDALTNYISAIGYGEDGFVDSWPANFHVIGKDILVPPHAVYWPIMLKACGLELPKTILAHGWWLVKGGKMGKSEGNSVDPLDLIGEFSPDAFRYFVMREMSVGQDSEFSLEHFTARYNSDLANDLGNLTSRLLNMCGKFCEGGVFPKVELVEQAEKDLRALWDGTRSDVTRMFDELAYHMGLERVVRFVSAINAYIQSRKPWELAKSVDSEDQKRVQTALATAAEGLRLAATAFAPVMPTIADQILGLLGEGPVDTWEGALDWSDRLAGNSFGEKTVLFPRAREA